MAKMELSGKVVVITGASGGIGTALAKAFTAKGAKLVLSARGMEALNRTADAVKALGGEALAIRADVTKPEDMAGLVAKAIERFGRVDVMVLNAGLGIIGDIWNLSLEDWHHQMDVNFWGVLHGFYAALPEFLTQGAGQFVVINSLSGKIAMPLNATYCASKFALQGFADSVRAELKPKNIDMISIYPGFVRTPFQSHISSPDYNVPPNLGHAFADSPEKAANAIVRACEKRKGEVIFTLNGSFGARFLPVSYTIAEGFRKIMLYGTRKMIKRKK
jgi:short-subunit dehydrogenase